MTTTTTGDERSTAQSPPRVGARVRAGQVVLALLLIVMALVAVSTAFASDPFPRPAIVLIATFGVLAALFGLVAVWSVRRQAAARAAVWALPLFFVVHVAALGTWVPDAGSAVLALVGALLVQGRRA